MFVDNHAGGEKVGEVPEVNKVGEEIVEKFEYKKYCELGGIINEGDYSSALTRAKETVVVDEHLAGQAKSIAEFAGISLGENDPRVILYGVLRKDTKPDGGGDHHSSMSDQQLFVEALRMYGDEDALKKCIDAYPYISFDYGK
jgi:hypothetical protein